MARPATGIIRKSLGIRVQSELIKRLKILAIQKDMPLNVALEKAIEDYLLKNRV